MALIQLESACLSYGEQHLLDNVNINAQPGERVGLIGRNGEGKSTLLKILTDEKQLDAGKLIIHPDLRISVLSQDLPAKEDVPIEDYVSSGMEALQQDLHDYGELSARAEMSDMDALAEIQSRIDAQDGWNFDNRLDRILKEFNFERGQLLSSYSGGWRRKAALAKALISNPEVLLLDEPTNHLDIGIIAWLEQYLKTYTGALIFITHDRAFLKSLATRIWELDRGRLQSWKGDYDGFLVHKDHELETEKRHNALFDKRLAQEEVWIRQGIKARRTRNEGRVRALEALRKERGLRRERKNMGSLKAANQGISGKLVAELDNVSFAYGDRMIIKDFSCIIERGDKIGLIGPNGYGKSTLLKLILGEETPQTGQFRSGTKLKVAYLDQFRDQLDLEKTVLDNVAEGSDTIDINGVQKHVLGYLQEFMFTPARSRTPVKALSGGEKARVMMAKLFSKPSNMLILDEPTNDLDTETLDLLESLIANYPGTVLLVSHDREFLNNVVTSSIVFEGNAHLEEFVGGYDDWIRQGGVWPEHQELDSKPKSVAIPDAPKEPALIKPAKKLSYSQQRELDGLPAKLEKSEAKVEEISAKVGAADFYQSPEALVASTLKALADAEQALAVLYTRWEELEA
ncbi:MAG: ATP-binding cassette subfamily F protein uup [Flavobacteriales bacterium]|jgi:ATP-binding cassette subfamily F protein uup